jgi:Asp-tRNA(Asn)/Glu-tRNA(Gln) amidotransferase B subunit
MAPFRLRKEARKWFKEIEKGFASEAPQFEMYYFCLAAGLAAKRKADVITDNTAELVDYFPGQYRAKGRIIVAWFLARELESMGIKMHERDIVHMTIAKLVDPLSPSHLSDEGMKEMNRYSYGGFDVLTDEWFDAPPTTIETFLPLFKQKIEA